MDNTLTKSITQTLESYQVDPQRGFLPTSDPLIHLPNAYASWDELAINLTAYINAGCVREKINGLPLIEHPEFETNAEWERAMLLLSFFAHAYVHLPPEPVDYIPETVAIPWIKVANALKRKPVISHSSIVLQNWKRLDPARPIQMDNLALLCHFYGGLDESWFYLLTVEIEQVGAKAIPIVLEAMQKVEEGMLDQATARLKEVTQILGQMLSVFRRMYECCDPYIFYHRVRPFIASFEKVEYKGTGLEVQSHHGASAAQSSLLQFFDAAFGIEYENTETREYLHLMRRHMPYKHAEFLEYVGKTSSIREKATKSQDLEQVYKEAVQLLIEFRNEHLKMVALYIIKQAKESQNDAKGTGGTNPMVFLKSVRNQNEEVVR